MTERCPDTALLSAKDLGFAYGSHRVVDQLSLRVEPGTLGVVLGPNGAGKTTLLRLLSGVLAARSGSVDLLGQPLRAHARRAIARVLAVVPQEIRIPFSFRVRELVAMGRAPHLGVLGQESAYDRDRVAAAIASLDLQAFAERRFDTLSGGEKQRVLLARALAQETDLLLLDEPTAHMDLGHRYRTFEWLAGWIEAAPERRAALVVTHDLVLAARFAHTLWLLDGGRLVAQGTPREVLTRERIADVYGVAARVQAADDGSVEITPERSRIDRSFR